jgi:hypothetical protein
MEVDTIRQMVTSVDWKNQEEHINMLHISIGLVFDFYKLGFSPVIVVDTFSGDKINRYLETLYRHDKELSIKIFGLFTTDDELKRRLALRTSGEFRDFSICKKLNDDILKFKLSSKYQIDTTGLLSKHSAERIYGQIYQEHTSR